MLYSHNNNLFKVYSLLSLRKCITHWKIDNDIFNKKIENQ